MKRLYRFLTSTALAIWTMSLLTVAMIVGSMQIPPGPTRLGRISALLGLYWVYGTAWFLALVGLFVVALTLCTVRRLPQLAAGFRERSPRRWSRLGSAIAHVSLLLIAAGAVVRGTVGVRALLSLQEGETVSWAVDAAGKNVKLPFAVRGESLTASFFGGKHAGMPAEFRSDLVVEHADGSETPHALRVNHPYDGEGWSLFQSSYEVLAIETVGYRVERDGEVVAEGEATVGQPVESDDGATLRIERAAHDFLMNGSEVGNRSGEARNPAFFYRLSGCGEESSGWAFLLHPGFAHSHGPQRVLFTRLSRARIRSIIEVRRDPGLPLVWAGCTLMLVGVALAFGVRH